MYNMLEMDLTNTQPLLHAYIKYCARTLILRALVYVLVTFFVLFRIKTYISFFGRYFFVKSTGYGPRHRQTVK